MHNSHNYWLWRVAFNFEIGWELIEKKITKRNGQIRVEKQR
jgi:hypothetical protein